MVRSLRKYLCNRGSALFMVVSTMTALMITCMAMYFSVVSMRSVGFAMFNQQQSYQSSISVANMIVNNFGTIIGNNDIDLASVEVGETILSTEGNGFKSLGVDSGKIDDGYLGAYDVTMTRLEDEVYGSDTCYTVDIAVTASVSGVREVFHHIISIMPEKGSSFPNRGKIFASTGYVPFDSFISKGSFFSDIYISNEDAVGGAFSGTELFFYSNIYCENSFTLLDGVNIKNYASGPIVHAVRRDYNIGSGDGIDIDGTSYIFVGNDMHLARAFNVSGSDTLEVYVGGNLYIEPGAQNLTNNKIKFYVAGNVYVNTVTSSNCIPGVVYCNKMVFKDGYNKSNYNPGAIWEENNNEKWWEADQNINHGSGSNQMTLTFGQAMKMLEEYTPDIKYMLWKLDENKLKSAVGTVKEDGTISGGKKVDLVFHSINNQSMYEPIELKYSKDNPGCIIQNIKIDGGGNNIVNNMPTLIVDTGDDTSNTFTIRLQNNSVSSKGTKYFTWSPKNPDGSQTDAPMQVLVKGNGSLVIDVPEGVVYQDSSNVRVAHYNWYMLTEGSGLNVDGGTGKKYYVTNQGAFTGAALAPYVHSSCEAGDGCNYTSEKTSEPCVYCGGAVTYNVKCDKHEEYTVCPTCDSKYFTDAGKAPEKSLLYGICKDRVERNKCRNSLAAIDSASRPVNRDSKGNIVIPHCNIYLVSCSESADFRFGQRIDDSGPVAYNCFAGFIYAPYMSYRANGSDLGDFLMHMGGMVVSDYKFLSKNSFIACWPSVYPPENVLDQTSLSTTLNPISEKKYRVRLKASI